MNARMNYIYVEGDADEKFISDFIKVVIPQQSSPIKFVRMGNWQSLPKYEVDIRRTFEDGDSNIVILDADRNRLEKLKMISALKTKINREFQIDLLLENFLFPNDKDEGTLEDLLLACTNPEHHPLLACFDNYQTCVDHCGQYTRLNKKSKIYAYCEAILTKNESNKIKERERDYLDNRLWIIENSYTKPLKDFLIKNIS